MPHFLLKGLLHRKLMLKLDAEKSFFWGEKKNAAKNLLREKPSKKIAAKAVRCFNGKKVCARRDSFKLFYRHF